MKKHILIALLLCALLCACGGQSPRTGEAVFESVPPAPESAEPAAAAESPVPTSAPTPEPPPCRHESWQNGVCVNCGFVCPHETHTAELAQCPVCGEISYHTYVKGVCSCGAVPHFESDDVPAELFNLSDEPGTIEELAYETIDYVQQRWTGDVITLRKTMQVYLPYGYDESERYDVLILLHGMGGTDAYWLLDEQEYRYNSGFHVYTKDLIDNLMQSRYARKMIIVTPCFYRYPDMQREYVRARDEEQFVNELRYDILPAVAEHYSTWARSGSEENLIAARDHFAYAGLSMGSIYVYDQLLRNSMDLFSWFGCFSGSDCETIEQTAAMADAMHAEGYDLHYFYNSSGWNDDMRALHHNQYFYLCDKLDWLTDGENGAYTDVNGAYHEYHAWSVGLYNFLQVLFQCADE